MMYVGKRAPLTSLIVSIIQSMVVSRRVRRAAIHHISDLTCLLSQRKKDEDMYLKVK